MKPIDMLTGGRHSRAIADRRCTTCDCDNVDKQGFVDPLSAKEYNISGMCQRCQNKVFNAPDEDHSLLPPNEPAF